MSTILFVVTGARHWTLNDGTQHPTGYWAEELLAPYEAFTGAGHTVEFASPGGVAPVPDRGSLAPDLNDGRDDVEAVLAAIPGLAAPLDVAKVDVALYDAVFYPGGHGPMEDLAVDADSGRVLTETLAWQSIFVVQVPLTLLCLTAVPSVFTPLVEPPGERRPDVRHLVATGFLGAGPLRRRDHLRRRDLRDDDGGHLDHGGFDDRRFGDRFLRPRLVRRLAGGSVGAATLTSTGADAADSLAQSARNRSGESAGADSPRAESPS